MFVQSLTSLSCLRNQITAQDKWNVDLAASKTSMRKANAELIEEIKGLSTKVLKLKSKIEELDDNHAELIK